DLKLFEFGKVYYKLPSGYEENKSLSVFLTGGINREQWNNIDEKVSFFDLKGIVEGILGRLNIKKFQTRDVTMEAFSYGLTYARGEQVFVSFGVIDKKVLKMMDVQGEVLYADFNWDA